MATTILGLWFKVQELNAHDSVCSGMYITKYIHVCSEADTYICTYICT